VPGHRKIEGDIRRVNALEANYHMDSLVDPAQCHVPGKFPAEFPAIRRTGNKGCIISANSDSLDRRFRVAPIRHLRVAPGEQHKVPARGGQRRVIRRHSKALLGEGEAGSSRGAAAVIIAIWQLQRRGRQRRGHGGARHRETGSPRGRPSLPHGQRPGGQQEHAADDERPWRGRDSKAITSRLSDAGKTTDDTGPGRRQSRDSRWVAAMIGVARH